MGRWSVTGCLLVISLSYIACQVPPRLQIPGAIPVGGGSRPAPFRIQNSSPIISNPRLRRPNAIPTAAREVRPVIEDVEEPNYPSPSPSSAFDDEVNKILQSSREEEDERPTPLPFRPERPVPISRDQIRERNTISRPQPAPRPQSQLRQENREENIPVRQAPIRQQINRPTAAPQTFRAPAKHPTRQQAFEEEEERERRRGPVVQILRKYRTDNEDGSITWGFENDDGTFKEETLGIDCIIRGNYGYVDPDGVKREFSYEAGNKCDEPDPEEEEELLQKPSAIPQSRNRPLPYRPAAEPQYVN